MSILEVLGALVTMNQLEANYDKGKGVKSGFIGVKKLSENIKMEIW